VAQRHFILCPFGSGGDVYPFIGIGRALKARGHRVTMLSMDLFEAAIRQAGFEYVSIGTADDFEKIANDPRIWKPITGSKLVFKAAAEAIRLFYDAIVAQVETPANTIIVAAASVFGARLAREKLGVPLVTVQLQPAVFLSVHDTPVMIEGAAWISALPVWFKRLLFALPNPMDQIIGPALQRECQALNLEAPRKVYPGWWHSPDLTLALFPEWFAAPQPDWPQPLLQHGFPLEDLAADVAMSPELQAFLAAGDKPLVFTPGTGHRHVRAFFQAALEATQRLGCRAIFATRQVEDLPPLPPSVLAQKYVPFSQLLPHAAALIYHGGIGTCSQALAAGIPHLVMAMAHDQPDNANRLRRLGVGSSLKPKHFTGERVAAELRKLLHDPTVQERVKQVAALTHQSPDLAALAICLEKCLSLNSDCVAAVRAL
jgi:rhamnosyltransferase subunit B